MGLWLIALAVPAPVDAPVATAPAPSPIAAPTPAQTAPSSDAAPVTIDAYTRPPDGPPSPASQAYEAHVRASFQAVEGLQGPLDGRWMLSRADGTSLYSFQITDPGQDRPVEGAWRDLRAGPAIDGSGFLTSVSRDPETVTIRFPGRDPSKSETATLHSGGYRQWTGELQDGAATAIPVVMKPY